MAIYSEFSHEKWWFSIVMLVLQRVFGCKKAWNAGEKREFTMNMEEIIWFAQKRCEY